MLRSSVAVSPRCGVANRVSWKGPPGPRRRRLCMQWTAMRVILRSTDRPPRPQRKLSSLQTVDFFQLLPTVGRIRGLSVGSPSISRRWSSCWSFVLLPRWLVSFDRCRAHPMLTPSLEFIRWIPVLHISYSIYPIRCFPASFSLVARSCRRSPVFRTCLHSRHRSGLDPVTHSATYNVVLVRPSSVETALSQFYGRGFCLDRGKIRESRTRVVPTIRLLVSSHYRQRWSVVPVAAFLLCPGLIATVASRSLHILHSWRRLFWRFNVAYLHVSAHFVSNLLV